MRKVIIREDNILRHADINQTDCKNKQPVFCYRIEGVKCSIDCASYQVRNSKDAELKANFGDVAYCQAGKFVIGVF